MAWSKIYFEHFLVLWPPQPRGKIFRGLIFAPRRNPHSSTAQTKNRTEPGGTGTTFPHHPTRRFLANGLCLWRKNFHPPPVKAQTAAIKPRSRISPFQAPCHPLWASRAFLWVAPAARLFIPRDLHARSGTQWAVAQETRGPYH